jgi:hypothetical protein
MYPFLFFGSVGVIIIIVVVVVTVVVVVVGGTNDAVFRYCDKYHNVTQYPKELVYRLAYYSTCCNTIIITIIIVIVMKRSAINDTPFIQPHGADGIESRISNDLKKKWIKLLIKKMIVLSLLLLPLSIRRPDKPNSFF